MCNNGQLQHPGRSGMQISVAFTEGFHLWLTAPPSYTLLSLEEAIRQQRPKLRGARLRLVRRTNVSTAQVHAYFCNAVQVGGGPSHNLTIAAPTMAPACPSLLSTCTSIIPYLNPSRMWCGIPSLPPPPATESPTTTPTQQGDLPPLTTPVALAGAITTTVATLRSVEGSPARHALDESEIERPQDQAIPPTVGASSWRTNYLHFNIT